MRLGCWLTVYLSFSQNSSKGLYRGLYRGLLLVGVIEGDTRSFDYGLFGPRLAWGCNLTTVKADVAWPTLTDDKSDARDVVVFYEEFANVCALAKKCP